VFEETLGRDSEKRAAAFLRRFDRVCAATQARRDLP
jgi:hypothetical protein